MGIGAKVGTKLLKPVVGKAISRAIGQGAFSGGLSGGLSGTGHGLMTNQNPVVTGIAGIAGGAIGGGTLGGIGGKIEQLNRAKVLKGISDTKTLRNEALKYYDDYLLGTSVNHPQIGKVELSNIGSNKIRFSSADKRKLQMFPEIPSSIKKAHYEGFLPPKKENAKFDKYYYLTNKTNINKNPYEFRITVGNDANGKKLYNINDIDYHPPFGRRTLLPNEQNSGTDTPDLIITDNAQKFNPSNGQKSKLWDVIHNQKEKAFDSLYDLIHRNKW